MGYGWMSIQGPIQSVSIVDWHNREGTEIHVAFLDFFVHFASETPCRKESIIAAAACVFFAEVDTSNIYCYI